MAICSHLQMLFLSVCQFQGKTVGLFWTTGPVSTMMLLLLLSPCAAEVLLHYGSSPTMFSLTMERFAGLVYRSESCRIPQWVNDDHFQQISRILLFGFNRKSGVLDEAWCKLKAWYNGELKIKDDAAAFALHCTVFPSSCCHFALCLGRAVNPSI